MQRIFLSKIIVPFKNIHLACTMENLTIKSIELITLISNKIKLIIITFFQLEKKIIQIMK